MEMTKITKQMIDFQKAAFDNTFTGMAVFQDYSENMMNGILRQFPWVTDETKKPINDSMAFMKKARNDYKKVVDQSFAKLEEMSGIK